MKLFGKISEFTVNEIYLYAVPLHQIKTLIKDKKDFEITVREYKLRKNRLNQGDKTYIVEPNKSDRHQILLTLNLTFAVIKLYSAPLNHKDLENMCLEGLEEVTRKEKIQMSVNKITNVPDRVPFYERIKELEIKNGFEKT